MADVPCPQEELHDLLHFKPKTLSPRSEQEFKACMERFRAEAKLKGITIKQVFRPFDHLNRGFVTQKQFESAIPFEVTPRQRSLLVKRYSSDVTGDVNYMAFGEDINPPEGEDPDAAETAGDSGYYFAQKARTQQFNSGTLQGSLHAEISAYDRVMERLKEEVATKRIRMLDFFQDYDKFHTGHIAEPQFRSGFNASRAAQWASQEDINELVYVFGGEEDGKVRYIDFCCELEGGKNWTKELTKNPALEMPQPAAQLSSRTQYKAGAEAMDSTHLAKAKAIIGQFTRMVVGKRIPVRSYFVDFDRTRCGRLSPSHFRRAMSLMKVELNEEDFQLVTGYYSVEPQGMVDYLSFVRDVDPQDRTVVSPSGQRPGSCSSARPAAATEVEVQAADVIWSLQARCISQHLRLRGLFSDFDSLRSGYITKGQFVRSLGKIGVSFTPKELDVLAREYSTPNKPDMICYTDLSDEVESVFYDGGLSTSTASGNTATRGRQFTPKDTTDQAATSALEMLRKLVASQRVLLLPFFKDFDKHNHGKCNAKQFSQALSTLGFALSEQQVKALSDMYSDQTGFVHYLPFVQRISTEEQGDEEASEIELAPVSAPQCVVKSTLHPNDGSIDVDALMAQLQRKALRQRIRPAEFFTDFDRLSTGRVPQPKFRCALELCSFTLTGAEHAALEDRFRDPDQPQLINYRDFCDNLSDGCTRLEKTPTKEFADVNLQPELINDLSPEDEAQVAVIVARLRRLVHVNRINIKPTFEDFDKRCRGKITLLQFESSLNVLKLAASPAELDVLKRKYRNCDQPEYVNYQPFLRALGC
eukprot:TRINITY_DN3512_c0_g1_i1.p1 TRINITY_DN3512_c0_g1~~TRINITY_DN3512_c0_g1_i1.p1  ORF type:complete len:919 (-),score=238.89 TRINITY_DN3512_c0_g1_i1:73-2514(-)